uniref:Sphingomyelin phosphodiesterase n=1 Tax=Syphacia muris TaxID=451379 RepID=A0A0N5AF90_9BILA
MRYGLVLLLALAAVVTSTPLVKKPLLPSKYAMANKLWKMAHEPKNKKAMCVACTVIVDGVQILLKQNKTDEEIENFVIILKNIPEFYYSKTCKTLAIEADYVCDHFVHEFGDEAFFVLERVLVTPHEICGALVEDCGTAVNPLNQMWNLTIPARKPQVKPWPTPAPNKPTMRILHLSDIHVDRHYAVGSEAECEEHHPFYEFCCLEFPNERPTTPAVPAGKWGMPYKCDIPYITFESLIKQISEREKVDYIYITGDMEAHNIWDYTREDTMANLNNISSVIHKYFPKTPIFEAIGNHEGVPMDAIAAHGMEEYDKRGPQWLYNTLANNWKPYLTDAAVETVNRASYSIKLKPKLKLISINTVYCSMMNLYNYMNQKDPDGTLKWLITELLASEQAKEKVHIISHIPPGVSYCLKGWSHNFYRIVNRFENTIAAMFFGHTHSDHFQVYYDNLNVSSRPIHVNYIAPSLTTYAYNNPAYRIYTVDGDYSGSSYTVLDTDTYSADILTANAKDQPPQFKHTYSAKADYGLKDLSPKSWDNLIKRMNTDDKLFKQYLW